MKYTEKKNVNCTHEMKSEIVFVRRGMTKNVSDFSESRDSHLLILVCVFSG